MMKPIIKIKESYIYKISLKICPWTYLFSTLVFQNACIVLDGKTTYGLRLKDFLTGYSYHLK